MRPCDAQPPAGPAHLQVRGLGFGYGTRPVLDGIDLDLHAGEVVGLVGPNGSGKSTLLKILSGVLADYAGSVRLHGRELSAIPARELARVVATVPQETGAGLPFTALEVVLMGRHPHLGAFAFEGARDLHLARTALARAGAADFADRDIRTLSSGERQRVVFARALAQEPRVMLLDEPTSFLDLRYQVELYDLTREQALEHGVAVLTALHDLNLAAEYCDRLVLLAGGRVYAAGPTDAVLTYAHLTAVFGTDVYVDTNDLTGKLLVIPLSSRARRALGRAPDADGRTPDA